MSFSASSKANQWFLLNLTGTNQVTVQIDGIETHTIVPQGIVKNIELDDGETKKFCKSGKSRALTYIHTLNRLLFLAFLFIHYYFISTIFDKYMYTMR